MSAWPTPRPPRGCRRDGSWRPEPRGQGVTIHNASGDCRLTPFFAEECEDSTLVIRRLSPGGAIRSWPSRSCGSGPGSRIRPPWRRQATGAALDRSGRGIPGRGLAARIVRARGIPVPALLLARCGLPPRHGLPLAAGPVAPGRRPARGRGHVRPRRASPWTARAATRSCATGRPRACSALPARGRSSGRERDGAWRVGPGPVSRVPGVTLPRWEVIPLDLQEEGSGVAAESVRVLLDGELLVVEPDLPRSRLWSSCRTSCRPATTSGGRRLSDQAGNQGQEPWTFSAANERAGQSARRVVPAGRCCYCVRLTGPGHPRPWNRPDPCQHALCPTPSCTCTTTPTIPCWTGP